MTTLFEADLPRLRAPKGGRAMGVVMLLAGLIVIGIRFLPLRRLDAQVVPPLRVETLTVESSSAYTVSRTYAGRVIAGRMSELGFEQGGKLIDIAVERGDSITAGEPLAQLDTRQLMAQRSQLVAERDRALAQLTELRNGPRHENLEAAQATVRDLENQLTLERLRQDRRESLYNQGAISREERDVVALGAEALAERLVVARSQLEELQAGTRTEQIAAQAASVRQLAARIAEIDVAIEKHTIFAPFSGVIAARHLAAGDIVDSGQPVLRLIEQSTVEVEVGLPVEVAATLALGQPQPLQIGEQHYEGTIAAILPEVDSVTRTQTVVIQLSDVSLDAAAPEQLATVEIAQTIPDEGFWLPLETLIEGERGLWAVYALAPGDEGDPQQAQIQRRAVELVHIETDRAFVRGLLDEGDRIVVDGVQRFVPGQAVRLD